MNALSLLTMTATGRMLLRVDSIDCLDELAAYRAEMVHQGREPVAGESAALAARERELRGRARR